MGLEALDLGEIFKEGLGRQTKQKRQQDEEHGIVGDGVDPGVLQSHVSHDLEDDEEQHEAREGEDRARFDKPWGEAKRREDDADERPERIASGGAEQVAQCGEEQHQMSLTDA
jgi:hypothetical protein